MKTTHTAAAPMFPFTAIVAEGCARLGLRKGARVLVQSAEPMGPDYSHQARIVVAVPGVGSVALWVRHPNRLADPMFNVNRGNPLQTAKLRRV